MTNEKKKRSVYHLHLYENNVDEYYGSLSALYSSHDREELGITIASITNFFNRCKKDGVDYLYINKMCSIRKAELITRTDNKN